SGEVQSGPADVYSLAKTLWALAAHRTYPLPGELRRDRENLRLSTHTSDPRAFMLEVLLERATADNPALRPTMREFADERKWWGDPAVPTEVDLSAYVEEVERLRQATTVVAEETPQHRWERLYNEALQRVSVELGGYLKKAVESAGLR